MPPDFINSTHTTSDPTWKTLAELSLPNQPGSDRLAGEQALEMLKGLGLSWANRNRLKTAIAEAVLHTLESDHHSSKRPIHIRVLISEPTISGQETIQGQRLISGPQAPDSASLVSGQPLPRGWGFFLFHKTENPEQTHSEDGYYLIELFLYREDDLSRPDPTTGEVL
ncbi:MAG: hypothetical protein L6R45_05575 [Anaerolineae bacterium]|nr:hypothetical protein [Anaerolineae bacterium]